MTLGESAGAVVFALICAMLIGRLIRDALTGRRLAARRTGRSEQDGLSLAQAALAEYSPDRVSQAYRWVQDLVPTVSFPVYPQDDLLQDLEIDQGEVDGKFEACYDCFGEECDKGAAASEPLRTAEQLMRAVLAAGYENYPKAPRAQSASAA